MPDVCGLPLVGGEDITQPIAALVVVKCFDPDAEAGVRHPVRATEGLSVTEALGMARKAVVELEEALRPKGGTTNG